MFKYALTALKVFGPILPDKPGVTSDVTSSRDPLGIFLSWYFPVEHGSFMPLPLHLYPGGHGVHVVRGEVQHLGPSKSTLTVVAFAVAAPMLLLIWG